MISKPLPHMKPDSWRQQQPQHTGQSGTDEHAEQVRCLRRGRLLGQHMPQRAGQVSHSTFGIQVHLQTDTLHAQGVWHVHWRRRMAIEQAPEEFVCGTQNCRLELAERFAGRLGTWPIPGTFRNGMTCCSLLVG